LGRREIALANMAVPTVIPPSAQALRAERRVPADGVVLVAGQRLRVGRSYAGKTVIIVIEDIVFRVQDGDVELSTHARTSDKPVTQCRATARTRN